MTTIRVVWILPLAIAMLAAGFALGSWRKSSTSAPSGNKSTVSSGSLARSEERGAATVVGNTMPEPATGKAGDMNAPPAIIARLTALKVVPQDARSVRALLVELEKLRELGGAAVPAIRVFLAGGADVDYNIPGARGGRNGSVPLDFTVPPSLRLGLFEVLKNIGGPEAESVLLRELQTTGRGVEAAYLGGVLQAVAPEQYRPAALTAARDLLAMPLTTATQNPLDRSDREYLYAMLAAAGDQSQVGQAQSQLLLPNGQIDQGALRYLHQLLGEKVIPIAVQAWEDRSLDPKQREPLARLALAYVGRNETAEQLYRAAIGDAALSPGARKNLIEDLNETGFADPKHLTAADLPLIQSRLALIEQLAPQTKDRANAAAFAEARKDLLNMRDELVSTATPKK